MAEPLPLPKGYQRLGAFPIDKDSVFTDLATMEAYIAGGSSYAGQVVALVDVAKNEVSLFKVLPNKTYGSVGGTANTNSFSQTLVFRDIEVFEFTLSQDYKIREIVAENGIIPSLNIHGTATDYVLGDTITAFNRIDISVNVLGAITIKGEIV